MKFQLQYILWIQELILVILLFFKIKLVNVKKQIPYDFLKNTQRVYNTLLVKFIHFIEEKKTLPEIKQNHKLSTYYPLLNTEVNGLINWNHSGDEIEKFIRAFSYPYPGASTYLNGKQRIHILKAKILEQINIIILF